MQACVDESPSWLSWVQSSADDHVEFDGLCGTRVGLARCDQAREELEARIEAIYADIDRRLSWCTACPITTQDTVPQRPGIYVLYYEGVLSYIGSTVSLRTRLREHRRSLEAAARIALPKVLYRIVEVPRTFRVAAEERLVDYYLPPWNETGFGSKTNGNGRRHGKQSVWDEMYGRMVVR